MSYVEVCKTHGQHHGEICGDCHEELKERNEYLENQIKVMDKRFAAEIGELGAENVQLQEEYKKLFEHAKSENARLREALFKIVHQFPENYDNRITEIARAALEGKG